METIEKSIHVNSTVDRVFSYVDDPNTSTQWLPGMVEIHRVTGQGVGQRGEWTYKMAGVPLKGESTTTEHVPNELRVVKSKGGVESLWKFHFVPEDGGTRLDLTIEYTVPIPVLGALAERLVARLNEREIDLAMQNIKDYCEA